MSFCFFFQIGDIIESGPPQTRSSTAADSNRNTKKNKLNGVHCNGNNNEESDSESGSSDELSKKPNMKTRHISASSSSSMTNGNTVSQPLRKAKRKLKLEDDDDEEVSFSDTAFEQVNGKQEEVFPPGPACSKRKRKSLTEKFLEDNDNYYGIQVLPNKLRNQTTTNAAAADLNAASGEEDEQVANWVVDLSCKTCSFLFYF